MPPTIDTDNISPSLSSTRSISSLGANGDNLFSISWATAAAAPIRAAPFRISKRSFRASASIRSRRSRSSFAFSVCAARRFFLLVFRYEITATIADAIVPTTPIVRAHSCICITSPFGSSSVACESHPLDSEEKASSNPDKMELFPTQSGK